MNFQLQFCEKLNNSSELEAVWNILCECDLEFLPPLSTRGSTFQSRLQLGDILENLPHSYYEEIIKQPIILAVSEESGKAEGFMTFKHNYHCEELKNFSPSNYITTICVGKNARNKGITRKLYQFLQSSQLPAQYRMPNLATRTWSTNASHLHILETLEFEVSEILVNHRGNGIDTIYFGKKVH